MIISGIPKVYNFHIRVLECSFISSLRTDIEETWFLSQHLSCPSLPGITIINLPFHGCIPCHSLNLSVECFQASDLCESVYSYAKLQDKKSEEIIVNVTVSQQMHVCVHKQWMLLTFHSSNDLVSHMPDLFNRKRLEVVLLQEIICAEAKQLKSDTNVTVVVKPVQHMDTGT